MSKKNQRGSFHQGPNLIQRIFRFPLAILNSILRFVTSPFRWYQAHQDKKIHASFFQRFMAILLAPIFGTIPALWSLLVGWTMTRHGKALLLGLPAVFLASLAVGSLAYSQYFHKPKLLGIYHSEVSKASSDQDLESAEIFLKKVISIAPDRESYQYNLAEIYLLQSKPEEGEVQTPKHRSKEMIGIQAIRRLAPEDEKGVGFEKAHMFVARAILRSPEKSKEQIEKAHQHLLKALVKSPEDSTTRHMAAKTAAFLGRFGEAEEHLVAATKKNRYLLLELAKVQRILKKDEVAKSNIRMCRDYFLELANRDPESPTNWAIVFDCEMFLGNYEPAIIALRKGQRFTDSIETRKSFELGISDAFLAWSQSFDKGLGDTKSFKQRLIFLENSLASNPRNKRALVYAANMALEKLTPEEEEKVDGFLRTALVEGTATSLVHMLLGSRYALKNDTEKAIFHLKYAQKLNKSSPSVLNNLAWLYSHKKEPELEKALELSNASIEIMPHPRFHHSRGIILTMLKRYDEAQIDLEKALTEMKNDVTIHDALAIVYKEKKMDEIAKGHIAKAKRIREQNKKDSGESIRPQLPGDAVNLEKEEEVNDLPQGPEDLKQPGGDDSSKDNESSKKDASQPKSD